MKLRAKEMWLSFWKDEDGIGTLEMLLIIALILVVAIAFRKWIMQWIDNLIQTANKDVEDTLQDNTINLPEP